LSRTTFRAASMGGKLMFGGVLKQLVAGIGPGVLAAVLSGRGEPSEPRARVGASRGHGNGNQR